VKEDRVNARHCGQRTAGATPADVGTGARNGRLRPNERVRGPPRAVRLAVNRRAMAPHATAVATGSQRPVPIMPAPPMRNHRELPSYAIVVDSHHDTVLTPARTTETLHASTPGRQGRGLLRRRRGGRRRL